jgi:hypothetical protein
MSAREGDRMNISLECSPPISAFGMHMIVLLHQPNINFLLPSSNVSLTSGEGSKTLMLVHVSPKEEDLCETICSLNFATRARSIDLGTLDSTVSKFSIAYLTFPFKKFNNAYCSSIEAGKVQLKQLKEDPNLNYLDPRKSYILDVFNSLNNDKMLMSLYYMYELTCYSLCDGTRYQIDVY